MTDIPIIFSGPMVRALLEGRKTMTRRLAWRDAKFGVQDFASEQLEDMELRGWQAVTEGGGYRVYKPTAWQKVKPGDRLYVRENFTLVGGGDTGIPIYAANWREDSKARGFDNIPATAPKWTPCIHMPRWASRLTLVVTAAKVERVQAISETDAAAEGIGELINNDRLYEQAWRNGGYRHAFECLWDELHGEDAWAENPEVVALTFTVHQQNIDTLKEAA